MQEFLSDFSGQIILIESPNINILAGRLRDIPYKHATATTSHALDSGDAMMLATALYLQEALG